MGKQTQEDPLFGSFGNLEAIEELYEQYSQASSNVDPSWQKYFEWFEANGENGKPSTMPVQPAASPQTVSAQTSSQGGGDFRLYSLIHAYREYGHLLAQVNPIATKDKGIIRELELNRLGFSASELDTPFPTCGLLAGKQASLREIVQALQNTYSRTIGVEYMEFHSLEMEQWLQQKIEPNQFAPNLSIEQKKHTLQNLNRSELFESFLHTKYTGQKRFSVEGAETLVPMLNAMVEKGAELGVTNFVMGMAHRGRLNVLANVMNKSYSEIFHEFEDSFVPGSFEGSGDVKYHKGYEGDLKLSNGKTVHIFLADNPSHLEAVNPVVEGMVRAKQIALKNDEEQDKVVPVLIHGDAAISGQGIVYETLQMYNLPGYSTGGTLHFIINNQIGFTTLPKDSRSTRYCTDIAKAFGAPIFHVNAEKPEECVYAVLLAMELRQKFHVDVFIELNGYRKYGHNEGDEPAFTQPLEYQLIRKKKPIREIYRDELINQGVLEKAMAELLEEEFKGSLQNILTGVLEEIESFTEPTGMQAKPIEEEKVTTQVSSDSLREVAKAFCTIPEGFTPNRKLKRLLEQRLAMLEQGDKKSIDWGMAEHLAFGTLIWEGHHVRLSGQDSRRGTFSHRHAMWVDQKNAQKFFPLSRLKEGQGRFDVFNSLLSEYGVLGFEYGYSLSYPTALVIWEAQFGDFCNGAQIIIDQFLSSSEQKWGVTSGLVMMLPHGYEGQGPEHSSARLERFLQLAGDENFKIVNASTPAQLFHLLRQQALVSFKRPLVILTPKALLRHPECVSSLADLTDGEFYTVLDDPEPPKKYRRALFCSGKIYYDLIEQRRQSSEDDGLIIRMEQLYPFDRKRVEEIIKNYHKEQAIEEICWVQEEPRNMGAWRFIRSSFEKVLPEGAKLSYHGRSASASPAVGSLSKHKRDHQAILEGLFKTKG